MRSSRNSITFHRTSKKLGPICLRDTLYEVCHLICFERGVVNAYFGAVKYCKAIDIDTSGPYTQSTEHLTTCLLPFDDCDYLPRYLVPKISFLPLRLQTTQPARDVVHVPFFGQTVRGPAPIGLGRSRCILSSRELAVWWVCLIDNTVWNGLVSVVFSLSYSFGPSLQL